MCQCSRREILEGRAEGIGRADHRAWSWGPDVAELVLQDAEKGPGERLRAPEWTLPVQRVGSVHGGLPTFLEHRRTTRGPEANNKDTIVQTLVGS